MMARGFNPKRIHGGKRGFEGVQLIRPYYFDDPRCGS